MATIGLDLGGTKILGARVASDGELEADLRVDTPDDTEGIVESLAHVARELDDAAAVGVGAAGMVDREGSVHYAPNIPALIGVPLQARLQETLGRQVLVDNDANVAALGEAVHGAARGHDEVLMITLGTGIGGGIVTNGHPYRGGHGFAAEIGHFQVVEDGPMCACGQSGHWEAVASGTALGRMARERVEAGGAAAALALAGDDSAAVTGNHLTAAALDGDAESVEIVAEYADLVAIGLAGLANILDPEMIVIGGGLITLGETLLVPLREAFVRRIEAGDRRPEIPIIPALLGESAGAIGAAVLAREVAGDG